MARLEPKDRLIVALDLPGLSEADALLDKLQGTVSTFKIGSQLFTAAGPSAVELAQKRGARVFLDLKFHDIPNTVAGAVREAVRLGVFMLNVHASGGRAMMQAAAEGARKESEAGRRPPILLAVTLLTSLDRRALEQELRVPSSPEEHALHLARLAKASGLDGSVASPQEVKAIRNALGPEWVIVTPGVRPVGSTQDDQARVATPISAIEAGADYLVVGRPILEAKDPAKAVQAILVEISSGEGKASL